MINYKVHIKNVDSKGEFLYLSTSCPEDAVLYRCLMVAENLIDITFPYNMNAILKEGKTELKYIVHIDKLRSGEIVGIAELES